MNHLRQTAVLALLGVLPAVLMAQAADTPELVPAVQRQRDVRNAIADIQQKLLLLVRFEQDPDIRLKALAARRMLRDAALIGQSEQVADLLRRKRFAKALDGQKELVDTLGELLDLLSRARRRPEGENDLRRQIAEEIDRLIDRQNDHLRGADASATKGADAPKAAALRDEQLDTLDSTKAVAETLDGVESLADVKETLASAAGKMKDAAAKLAEGESGAAGEAMADALEDLEDAAETLRERDRIEQIFMLGALLRRMLAAQQDLSRRTRLLTERPMTRLERLEFALLAKGERKLTASADEALERLQRDGSALVFPEAVKQVRSDLIAAAELLSRHDGGEITRGIQTDIERALLEMLDALAEAKNDEPPQPPPPPGDDPPPEGDPPIVSVLAELKLLRGMQDRCNRRTDRLAKAMPPAVGRPVGLIYLKQLGRTGEIQGGIGRLAGRLAEQLNR